MANGNECIWVKMKGKVKFGNDEKIKFVGLGKVWDRERNFVGYSEKEDDSHLPGWCYVLLFSMCEPVIISESVLFNCKSTCY